LKSGEVCTLAMVGAMRWERAPDEAFHAFRSRVFADASAAVEPLIVIGGLPKLQSMPLE
jgi:hypothetical protein